MGTYPTDDDFAEGATVYGPELCGYVACQFWTSQSVGSKGPFSIGPNPIHDGYGNMAAAGAAGGGQPYVGVLWRGLSTTADVVVRMTQRALIKQGTATSLNQLLRMQFVAARCSGGTVTAGTHPQTGSTPQRIVDITRGYLFGFVSNGAGASWYLLKISGGTVTTLAETAFVGTGVLTQEIDPFTPFQLSLDIESDGTGGVDLHCTVNQSAAAIPAPIASSYVGKVNAGGLKSYGPFGGLVNDSAASSPILAEGRCGFITTAAHATGLTGTNPNCAVIVSEFAIYAGSYRLLDDGTRYERTAGFQFTQGAPGYLNVTNKTMDLRCGWGGDYYARDKFVGVQYAGLLQRGGSGAWAGRVAADDTGANPSNPTAKGTTYFMSQILATDPKAQHRQLQFRFSLGKIDGTASGTSFAVGEFRLVGVGVRCSRLNVLPLDGYHVDVRPFENALAARVQLYRWDQGTPTVIAEDLGPTIALNTNYTLALRAYNLPDAAGNADGIVVLQVYLDGVQVPLVDPASGAVSGIEITAGTVSDSASVRTISGSGEYFRIAGPTGTDKATLIDDWTQNSLAASGVSEPESEQVTIAVGNEVTEYTATELTVPYDWPVEEKRVPRKMTWEFESGHMRTQLLDQFARRVFTIQAQATTTAERSTLLSFWTARRGCVEAFDWTPPLESSTIKVHFANDALATVLRAPGVFSFNFELEEVFD